MISDDRHVEALSRILLIQNMILGLPDLETMLSFTARGLEELPGFQHVYYQLGDRMPESSITENDTQRYPVQIGSRTFAHLVCSVPDDDALHRYQDYIRNVCFMIAARVDEINRTGEMARYREKLERENNALLKEVYHRTRNNMNVISAMLALQALEIDEPFSHTLARDTQRRIHAMALVHNMLYTSDNLVRISLPMYIRNLSESIIKEYLATHQRSPLIHISGADIQIGLDTAVSCGLVMNELLTASLITSDVPTIELDDPPTIHIDISRRGGDILIRYDDNEGRLAANLKEKSVPTLGFRIVQAITTDQLKGNVTVTDKRDTHITIDFPEDSHGL